MRILAIILVLIIELPTSLFGCSCAPPWHPENHIPEFEKSDYVVLAEIFQVSDSKPGRFKARAIEIFKGDLSVNTEFDGGFDWFCTRFVGSTGTWLIYGRFEDSLVYINPCGRSRDINHPELSDYYFFPPPKPRLDSLLSTDQIVRLRDSIKTKKLESASESITIELRELRMNGTSQNPIGLKVWFWACIGLTMFTGILFFLYRKG